MAYLDDHPPARSQFRCPRRALESGVIVVHTAENVMDTVGIDTGAEAVARFIQGRDTPGSYHELVDADSTVGLVRWDCEAFHDATGTNPHSFGLSFACSYLDWPRMTAARRAAFIEQGARRAAAYAKHLRATRGITIPARRISRAQSSALVPGFVSHAERDPERRKDPGNAAGQFPWTMFLARYADLMGALPDPTPPPPEDDDMRRIIKGDKTAEWWITDGITKRHVNDRTEAAQLVYTGFATWDPNYDDGAAGKGGPFVLPQPMVTDITVVPRGKALT